jgi:STE24 endopeptidase
MHLLTILAFAFLFWRADQPEHWVWLDRTRPGTILALAVGLPLLVTFAARECARRAHRRLVDGEPDRLDAQYFFHRTTTILRGLIILGYAGLVFLTDWTKLFTLRDIRPELQIVADYVSLTPYFAAVLGLWAASFPFERAVRGECFTVASDAVRADPAPWRFRSYLDFQIRHHLLIVAVPMTLILVAANITRGYEAYLQDWTGSVWASDAVLGVVAFAVFVTAPALLRRVWRTEPLKPGPVRERLDAMCRRIGLRCREILVWKSDGMMINAAVMGVIAPLRYVLLSDALLATMTPRQIEAVFGHEAGHVRKHHMQYFLLFALVGWFAVSGLMEWMALGVVDEQAWWGSPAVVIQGVGVLATMVFWGIGFGWLSHRFEQQADLFGARSVTPEPAECGAPCSVHWDDNRLIDHPHRGCATGAMVFASALDRVAVLNGIPLDEKGWRHPSISGRIRFLSTVAGDPGRAEAFERRMARLARVLVLLALAGAAATGLYLLLVPEPAVLRLQVKLM